MPRVRGRFSNHWQLRTAPRRKSDERANAMNDDRPTCPAENWQTVGFPSCLDHRQKGKRTKANYGVHPTQRAFCKTLSRGARSLLFRWRFARFFTAISAFLMAVIREDQATQVFERRCYTGEKAQACNILICNTLETYQRDCQIELLSKDRRDFVSATEI